MDKLSANELADGLKKSIFSPKFLDEAETMLRQQADRIAELEEKLLSLKHRYKALAYPENVSSKPVAWTNGEGHYFDKNSFFPVDDLIPLYTHPVKQLSDEEILKMACDSFYGLIKKEERDNFVCFVRAIIKEITE